MNAGTPLDLAVTGVAKSFGATQVLHDITVTIPDGQFVTLLGPSGCGKTTLLRIIAGFETPDRGSVTLGTQDLLPLPPHKRPVNTVFQSYALFPHLRVCDNVAFGLRSRRVPEAEVATKVADILEVVRIGQLAARYPHELSGGQRQRVALARALVNGPEVLLLDEPLSALDARLRHDVQVELKRIQKQYNTTFVLVTHDQDEAIAVSDRILIMNQGRIEQDGTPEQVYERPVSRFVAEFMGSANIIPATRLTAERVATEFGELGVASVPSWSAGHVAIRPEDIEVRQDGGHNRLPGTITDRLFRGDHWELIVTISAGLGQGRALRVSTEHDQINRVGEAVFLELSQDDLLVLRD
jgi:spermidine/putrescine transport system ATP-binding protein